MPTRYHRAVFRTQSTGGILLINPDMLRRLFEDSVYNLYVSASIVIFDEVHTIKSDTRVRQLVIKFDTPHRMGHAVTPITNCLADLYHLTWASAKQPFGTAEHFTKYFDKPIQRRLYQQRTDVEKATRQKRLGECKQLIGSFIHR